MSPAERIEALLTQARHHRREGDLAAVDTLLEEANDAAHSLGPAHPLTHAVAWKRAKVLHDRGVRAIDALAPLLEGSDPFAHYPTALRGADRLARHHQDRFGYGDSKVLALWAAMADHLRADHPHGWGTAVLQLAWDAACTGQLDALDRHLEALERSPVDGLGIDAAHTALRAASWSGAAHRVDEAWSWLEDAVQESGAPAAPVVREGFLEAAVLFGRPLPSSYPPGDPFRKAYQAVLRDRAPVEDAMALGRVHGPEWSLAAWNIGRHRGAAPPGGEELLEQTGCLAFRRR